jgi:hypothetical protein
MGSWIAGNSMKLQTRFVQLPVCFDAGRLKAEIGALPDSGWLPHPQGFPGNDFLPLVSAGGDPIDESFSRPMRPTPYLEQCRYLVDVIASLGVSIGRTRLMRLIGHAEVTPHIDIHYYWRDRMRVHVPIVTQPTVRFICGGEEVNMKEGECWIFDTWSKHRVINDAEASRVHLVVDTVGGEGFWDLMARGRAPGQPEPAGWRAALIEPFGANLTALDFEAMNMPQVMNPWEVRNHLSFLLQECDPNQPAFAATVKATNRFIHVWRSLWSTFGEDRRGLPRYSEALDQYGEELARAGAPSLKMRNNYPVMASIQALILVCALAQRSQAPTRAAPEYPAAASPAVTA